MPVWSAFREASCAVCGKVGPVEVHHFAPQARFPDAEAWPKADLCGDCHSRWHRVMG
jgi:predicted HNH restriction endonuclease